MELDTLQRCRTITKASMLLLNMTLPSTSRLHSGPLRSSSTPAFSSPFSSPAAKHSEITARNRASRKRFLRRLRSFWCLRSWRSGCAPDHGSFSITRPTHYLLQGMQSVSRLALQQEPVCIGCVYLRPGWSAVCRLRAVNFGKRKPSPPDPSRSTASVERRECDQSSTT